ncbi:MAG: branched-chain amino acid transport system II carrier protein [Chthoniobacterales bacterium]|nr:branched-chain amino acid transport system II carrier protein [Chthoniobacterales bacterium]
MTFPEFKKILITGFAMFAMLFGSGNVIFPLILGRDAGNQIFFGLVGFLLTAVLVPLLGLFSTMLSHGDYKALLAPLGKIPSFFIIFICMLLLGPFAIAPRCVTISYAAIKTHYPSLSLGFFSVLCAIFIFIAAVKKNMIVDLLGRFLGPIKIALLFFIIIKGLCSPVHMGTATLTKMQGFVQGILSGYGTCDLLGVIFLSGLILSRLQAGMQPEKRKSSLAIIKYGLQASAIGGLLLALVYMGFCVVAGFYGEQLMTVERGDLFSTLAVLVMGEGGGLLANVTIAISCIATAIALSAVFAMYLHKDLFDGRISYVSALAITSVITACMACLGFSGIMNALSPIIQVIYPVLIVYVLWNIAVKLWKLKMHQRLSITMKPESGDWDE